MYQPAAEGPYFLLQGKGDTSWLLALSVSENVLSLPYVKGHSWRLSHIYSPVSVASLEQA